MTQNQTAALHGSSIELWFRCYYKLSTLIKNFRSTSQLQTTRAGQLSKEIKLRHIVMRRLQVNLKTASNTQLPNDDTPQQHGARKTSPESDQANNSF